MAISFEVLLEDLPSPSWPFDIFSQGFLEWFFLPLFPPPDLLASPLDELKNFTKDGSSLSLETALLCTWQNAQGEP